MLVSLLGFFSGSHAWTGLICELKVGRVGLVGAQVIFFCLCHRLIILKGSVEDRGKIVSILNVICLC